MANKNENGAIMEDFKQERKAILLAQSLLNNIYLISDGLISEIAFRSMEPQCAKYLLNQDINVKANKNTKNLISLFQLLYKVSILIVLICFKVLLSLVKSTSINTKKYNLAFYFHVQNHWKVLEPIYNDMQHRCITTWITTLSLKKRNFKLPNSVIYLEKFSGITIFKFIWTSVLFAIKFYRRFTKIPDWGLSRRETYKIIIGVLTAEFYRMCTERFLSKVNVVSHVFGDDGGQNLRAIALTINEHGGGTFLVQHGIVADPIMYYSVCKTLFAWGEDSKKRFENINIEPNRIKVVGCPRIDTKINNRQLRIKGNSSSAIRIAIFSSPLPAFRETFSNIIKTLGKNSNFKLFLKVHPLDDIDFYLHTDIEIFPSHADSLDILNQVDMCLFKDSTIGIEAMAIGVVSVAIDSTIPNLSYLYYLSNQLDDIFTLDLKQVEKEQSHIIERVLLLDGGSVKRIQKFIL